MWAEREQSVSGAENGMSGSGAVSGCWKNHLSGSGAERAKSAAQIRSHQHCVDLAISSQVKSSKVAFNAM